MERISYVRGDATQPQGEGKKIILHICNDQGKWGKGFVLALTRRYPLAEQRYRKWYAMRQQIPMTLGKVQFVTINPHLKIVNMVAQHGIYPQGGIPPIRYEALSACLNKVAGHTLNDLQGAWSVHMPRIGAGLAGGEWSVIEELILSHLCDKGLEVTVYDLP